MNCQLQDNSPRRLDAPEEVVCVNCGTKYFVRIFPLRAECPMGELAEFLQDTEPETVGLGDVVADVIQAVTLGLLKPSPGCGCDGRKELLNQWWSWKSSR